MQKLSRYGTVPRAESCSAADMVLTQSREEVFEEGDILPSKWFIYS